MLSEQHRRTLMVGSAIPLELVEERGYRTITDAKCLLALGFADYQARTVPGLLVPIWGPTRSVPVSYQFRPDKPRTKDGKPVKYESLPNVGPRLDVPPYVRARIGDPKDTLWITEGAKKADAAAAKGLACVDVTGVWNFKGKNAEGGSVVIGDLDHVALKGRQVVICFDSDVMEKPAVHSALQRLGGVLKSKGAKVEYVTLPAEPGEKIGLDDFFAGGGTVEQLEALRSPKVPGDPEPKRRETRGGELVKMAESMEVELWHDEQGEPFATIPKNGHFETVRCESREMRGFLYSAWKGKTGTGASSDSLKEAADGLANQARFNGREYPTATRVGRAQGATYLFLADEEHRAVEITAAGWKVVPGHECSVKFVKSKTALPLPVPVQLGDLELLRRFLSVDAKGFELVKAFLLACLMPKGTFPVLVVGGEQGSGKSSGCRYIRWVLDPCEPMLGAWTADLRDMASAVKNNYILAFDNISSVPEKVADALCRILTGGGFANRELYTNAEEYVVRAWNPVLLNGIGSYATRGDLLDRALFVPFQPIEGTKGFKTEQSLEREFKETLPYILGGLLDLASTAMAKLAEVQGQGYENTRLSDLGLWIAASEPLATRGAFAKLLAEAKSETNRALLELDPAGSAILEFVQERQREWTGPLGELLKELKSHQAFNKDNPPPRAGLKAPKPFRASWTGSFQTSARAGWRSNGSSEPEPCAPAESPP